MRIRLVPLATVATACGLVVVAVAGGLAVEHLNTTTTGGHAAGATAYRMPPDQRILVSQLPAPVDPSYLASPRAKYLGMSLPGVPDSLAPVATFASEVGKRPNLIEAYYDFNSSFPALPVHDAYEYGALTLISWEPYMESLANIASGGDDAYLTSYAIAVRGLDVPVAISFGHEMNGDWYPWGMKTHGNTPAEFVAAWRHIHDVFASVKATNVIWVWDPNVTYVAPSVDIASLYPGDAYVTWVGATGYYTPGSSGRQTFATLFGPTLAKIRTFTNKPFLISETGVQQSPAKATETTDLLTSVADTTGVVGFVWFDYDKRADWRVESDPAALRAFASGVSGPAYGFDVSKR
jgi:hypothetical protein